jgi:FAD/FMN-containing dehydrogenase
MHVLTPETTPELFAAAGVALGLLGVVVEVTLQCEPRFDIVGEEAITDRADAAVDLFAETGPRSVASFLRAHSYARLLWWPQPGVDKLVVWTARREPGASGEPRPYRAFPRLFGSDAMIQRLAGLGMRGLDAWQTAAQALPRALRAATDPLRGALVNAFVPTDSAGPQQFRDVWWRALPMDDQIDERWMPVDFVEIWLPIDRAAEAMSRLRTMYEQTGWDLAVNAPVEIYAGATSRFWLSPGHGGERVRINVFWPRFNRDDPNAGSFAAHVACLAELGARFHWAKHVPACFGPAAAEAAYPQWDAFMALRARLDPDQLFLTGRWRRITGVAPDGAAAPRRRLELVASADSHCAHWGSE